MQRILPVLRDWPLHDVAASRAIERQSQAGLPPHALMERAGSAVAALARALHPHARNVWIACGPGNNGGDGLESAIHLKNRGWEVQVSLLCEPSFLPTDAAASYARACAAGVSIGTAHAPGNTTDLAIDALLGLGANRAAEGTLAQAMNALNNLACPVLAIDLPSGLNGDTGQANGNACVAADYTLSLLTLKPGLFTGTGRDHAGEVWFDNLDVQPSPGASAWLAGAQALRGRRSHAQHKGSFGDVGIVGGADGMEGAALLAARAAHAAGAGRVYVDMLQEPMQRTLDWLRPELMVRHGWWQTIGTRQTTVVAGCGGGVAIRNALPRLLNTVDRLVLDADALNAIASDAALARLLSARHSRRRETVLTPHPLEAARLLETDVIDIQTDRVAAASRLAQRFASVVVLKGSGSVIAAPKTTPWINGTGNAALASAGTGDVLAGWIGGCWSASGGTPFEAARHATWLHGVAAELSPTAPLRASDLVEAMHSANAVALR